MPDGLLLTGAGLVALVVFAAHMARRDRAAGESLAPDGSGWLLLVVGAAAVVSGSVLLWWELFSV